MTAYSIIALILLGITINAAICYGIYSWYEQHLCKRMPKHQIKNYIESSKGLKHMILSYIIVSYVFGGLIALAGWPLYGAIAGYCATHDSFQLDWSFLIMAFFFGLPMAVSGLSMNEKGEFHNSLAEIVFWTFFVLEALLVAFVVLVVLYFAWYYLFLGGLVGVVDGFFMKFSIFVLSFGLLLFFILSLLTGFRN